MEAPRLVWAVGSYAAGVADITRANQPDPCKRDLRLFGQSLDDALENEINRSRFGDAKRNSLKLSRFHGLSDTPDRSVTQQRDLAVDHGFLRERASHEI
jgi:hypothetical protein